MRLTLEVLTGPCAPRGVVIAPGTKVRVGRKEPCEVVLEADRLLSREHLLVSFDGSTCRLRDLDSGHGTFVKEEQVGSEDVVIGDGGLIRAGSTMFRVRVRPDVPPPNLASGHQASGTPTAPEGEPGLPLTEIHRRVLESLRSQPGNLYAVLDAARDEQVLGLLMDSAEHFQSLYEGPPAERYMKVAPYLVALPKVCEFLETLVREGWGKSWGIYLTCDGTFEEVRNRLRRSLTVKLEGREPSTVLFRFYDPRVFRAVVPVIDAEQAREFAGPIAAFLYESADGRIVRESLRGKE